jgi:aminoacrylate hydrolase
MPLAELGDVSLHYKEHGDGEPVIGIMGFALDQRFWATQIPAVTATHRFITFDHRGLGRSTRALPTSIEEMADDTVGLMDHLGIDKAIVFGISMGGAVAQQVALRHPDRVRGLILGVTWARPIEFMRRQTLLARDIIEARGTEGLLQAALLWMFTPEFFEMGRDVIDRMVAAFFAETGPEATEPAVLTAQLEAIEKHDTLAELGQISCPTLVLGGRRDMMVPAFASQEIARSIPGAELTLFETGHGCMVEEMEAFNARVAGFLAALG